MVRWLRVVDVVTDGGSLAGGGSVLIRRVRFGFEVGYRLF
jgi:hypothetical protein